MKEINFDISKERLIVFQEAADKIKINYRQGLLNKKSQVLFENRLKGIITFLVETNFPIQ